jgi:predicted transcriptional regulator
MARKTTPTLTEAEYRLMDILWAAGPLAVADVVERVGEPPLAYNTVLTTLRILEQKGYVRHKALGRAFVYRAIVARDAAQREVVNHVVNRFFGGSPRDLVLNLIESEQLDEAEWERLREMIARRDARA